MKFRKKPVVIEAIQWTGENLKEVLDFMKWRNAGHDDRNGLIIHTLEGNHHANPGDWIIKGVAGEFYPCKPDIFASTYEAAPGDTAAPETDAQRPAAWIAKYRGRYILDLCLPEADDDRASLDWRPLYTAPPAPEQAEQDAVTVPAGITIDRDLMGTMHIKCGDFDFIQIQYQYPYTDNASTRRLAEQIAALLGGGV